MTDPQMLKEEMGMSKISQFVSRHNVDGYDLINILESISRRVGASVDTLVSVALVDKNAADYLVGCCNRVSNMEKNADV